MIGLRRVIIAAQEGVKFRFEKRGVAAVHGGKVRLVAALRRAGQRVAGGVEKEWDPIGSAAAQRGKRFDVDVRRIRAVTDAAFNFS